MKIFEVLLPSVKRVLAEAGTAHIEDWVIDPNGGINALNSLLSLQKNPDDISIKWDGSVGIVFGRDADGNIVFVDHHQYAKVAKGKAEFSTIKAYDQERDVHRDELWAAEKRIVPLLQNIVPKVNDQYWFGDLMWSGEPDLRNGKYEFQPRTVKYQVDADSAMGKEIANSNGCIAVHTFIPGLGKPSIPLRGLQGLKEHAGIIFLKGEMSGLPNINIDKKQLSQAKHVVKTNTDTVNKFINDLTTMKAKTVLTMMSKFISQMIDEGDVSNNIVPRFIEFLKVQLGTASFNKLLGNNEDGWLYQADGGGPGLMAIWEMWAVITDLKLHVKQQIDAQVDRSEVRAFINGVEGHEGYVFGGGNVKLVDRLGFTKALRAKFMVSPSEIETKSKMPLAVFCFGRMNPPTLGHRQLMKKTVEIGGNDAYIFMSSKHDSDTDPLDVSTKAKFIKKLYPELGKHLVADPVLGPIYAANWLYDKGFRNITFVGGSDRLGAGPKSIEKVLNSWNSGLVRTTDYARGPKGREHVVLNFMSSGERDPESAGIPGISGTGARAAAKNGDERLFWQLTGASPTAKVNGKNLYQATRIGLGLKES